MRIHVCPLSKVVDTFLASGAGGMVSLLSPGHPLPDVAGLAAADHLHLALSDITAAQHGHVLAGAEDVERLIRFVRARHAEKALLIHCYAGVSRSTAAAFIALCALAPEEDEHVHAVALRRASPTATPNARLVAVADDLLGRGGRMDAAVAGIGRGSECFEGVCFSLAVPEQRIVSASGHELE